MLSRHELAVQLFEPVNSPVSDSATDAAWAAEIKRRIDEMKSGKVQTDTWDQVERMLDKQME